MKTFLAIVIVISTAITGIVAVIWLIILGEWPLVILSIYFVALSRWIIAFLFIPVLPLTQPLTSEQMSGGRLPVNVAMFCVNFYQCLVMLFWTAGSFIIGTDYYRTGSILPYMLVAYSVANAPWTIKAIQIGVDELGICDIISLIGLCLGAIVMMMDVYLYGEQLNDVYLIISGGILMLLAMVINNVIMIFVVTKRENKWALLFEIFK
jgi:hypothetical protein